jgi:glycogen synthase kinase 3 beta
LVVFLLTPSSLGADIAVEIIKIMGTPTKAQISAMNQSYTDFKFASFWCFVFVLFVD